MRLMQIAAVAVVAGGMLVGGVFGQFSGAKGVVNDKLKGVDEHNDAVNDAINDAMGGRENRPAQVDIAPGALKFGKLTKKSKDGKDVTLWFAYPAALNKS